MFAPQFPDDVVVCFHLKPEFIGTLYEGTWRLEPDVDARALARRLLGELGAGATKRGGPGATSAA